VVTDGYRTETRLWRWTGGNGGDWFFLSIGGEAGEALSATALMQRLESGKRSGWGSVKVDVEIGTSHWPTSAFPSKSEGWMVPVKAAVRKAEGIGEGDAVVAVLRF
jgi:hypothetical protein